MILSKKALKSLFAKFAFIDKNWVDSYWHKLEKIPASAIDGLTGGASSDQLTALQNALNNLNIKEASDIANIIAIIGENNSGLTVEQQWSNVLSTLAGVLTGMNNLNTRINAIPATGFNLAMPPSNIIAWFDGTDQYSMTFNGTNVSKVLNKFTGATDFSLIQNNGGVQPVFVSGGGASPMGVNPMGEKGYLQFNSIQYMNFANNIPLINICVAPLSAK